LGNRCAVVKREKVTKTTQQNKESKHVQFVFPGLDRGLLEEEEGRREGIYTRMAVTCGATRLTTLYPTTIVSAACTSAIRIRDRELSLWGPKNVPVPRRSGLRDS
jgi:hypothetical protein